MFLLNIIYHNHSTQHYHFAENINCSIKIQLKKTNVSFLVYLNLHLNMAKTALAGILFA